MLCSSGNLNDYFARIYRKYRDLEGNLRTYRFIDSLDSWIQWTDLCDLDCTDVILHQEYLPFKLNY